MYRRMTMVLLSALITVGCADDDKSLGLLDAGGLGLDGATAANAVDAAAEATQSAPGPVSDCYASPKTYLEIINACTDAEKVEKSPVLPLLSVDGGLPALP